ncbi:ring-infected erythrocyte surface antigen-like isoform X2 [Xenia sp. Carnegie-2017]|uniref:ring-infected erythrocyte surface antigen-like isoform X2 n=1 Tax=Xenia sp. Carnegie-2017 TaxID=2897299 RepID=UPI001F03798D|nr:ring-infected erythrocyte surface antigen-like isoform X2 [Xenia sp. Carnegie-2017]XP_046839385.1 ring-infected erythrocyte surface antigen-like isoform X2 [Xenia sp. Carnegie-2017]
MRQSIEMKTNQTIALILTVASTLASIVLVISCLFWRRSYKEKKRKESKKISDKSKTNYGSDCETCGVDGLTNTAFTMDIYEDVSIYEEVSSSYDKTKYKTSKASKTEYGEEDGGNNDGRIYYTLERETKASEIGKNSQMDGEDKYIIFSENIYDKVDEMNTNDAESRYYFTLEEANDKHDDVRATTTNINDEISNGKEDYDTDIIYQNVNVCINPPKDDKLQSAAEQENLECRKEMVDALYSVVDKRFLNQKNVLTKEKFEESEIGQSNSEATSAKLKRLQETEISNNELYSVVNKGFMDEESPSTTEKEISTNLDHSVDARMENDVSSEYEEDNQVNSLNEFNVNIEEENTTDDDEREVNLTNPRDEYDYNEEQKDSNDEETYEDEEIYENIRSNTYGNIYENVEQNRITSARTM